VDERAGKIYLRYSRSASSEELGRVEFDFEPRLDRWEHVCFVKKPEKGKDLRQMKFFANGEAVGQGKQEAHLIIKGDSEPP